MVVLRAIEEVPKAPGSLTLTSLQLDLDGDFGAKEAEAVAAAAAKPCFTFSSSTSRTDKVCRWFATKVSLNITRLSASR